MYIYLFYIYILKVDFGYLCVDFVCYFGCVWLGVDKIVWMNVVIVWIKCVDEKLFYICNYEKNDNILIIVKLCVDNC